MNVGIIGSGAISGIYLKNLTQNHPNIRVLAVASKHPENARKKAAQFGLPSCTVEELLRNPEIEMIVNLTPVGAHYEIIRRCLEAGKHVYTEKTLTDHYETAAELGHFGGGQLPVPAENGDEVERVGPLQAVALHLLPGNSAPAPGNAEQRQGKGFKTIHGIPPFAR